MTMHTAPVIEVPRWVLPEHQTRYAELALERGEEHAASWARRAKGPAPCPVQRAVIGPWTPEREAALRELHANGDSAATIARKIGDGITRNAVIGKRARLGLSVPTARKLPGDERKPAMVPAPKPPVIAEPKKPVIPKLKKPAAVAPEPTPAREGGVPFIGSSLFVCKFILGDVAGLQTMCCGAPATRGSYCEGHGARVYEGFGKGRP